MKQVLEAAKEIQDFLDEMKRRFCFIGGAIMCLSVCVAFGQAQIRLTEPTVMKNLRAKLAVEPTISLQKFAAMANKLAARQGYGFGFDPGTFKERSVRIGGAKLSGYRLRGTDGTRREFVAPEREDYPCGTREEFPVSWVKGKAFGFISRGKLYSTLIPRQFGRDEMVLVDHSLRTAIRQWDVPIDSVPEAISTDGTKVYLATELGQLYLEIDPMGTYRYVPSDASGLLKQYVDLTKFPKDKDNDYLGYREFRNQNSSYYIKFSWACT